MRLPPGSEGSAPRSTSWGRMLSTRAINDQNVSRKSGWSFARVQRESERTHEELIDAIRSLDVHGRPRP